MRSARLRRALRLGAGALGLGLALVFLAPALAGAASDVWGNVGPSPQLSDGGIAGRYPLTNYALDQHFDAVEASLTGGVDVSGVPAMIAWFFASILWLVTSFLASLLITLFSFAFSLDLVNGSQATGGQGALAPVSRAIHAIYSDVFGAPWLVLAIAIAGIWAMWKALVQRRYSETAGALGLSLIYVVLALFFVAQPGTTIGSVSKFTNEMSGAFLSISSKGSPSSAQQAKEDTANQLFDLLVFKPWVVLNFGGLEHCVRAGSGDGDSDPESVAVRPLSSNPERDAALAGRLRRGTEVSADGKICVNNANKYAPRFLRHNLGIPGKEERDREYDALNDGDASELPDAERSGYRLGPADRPASDAMEEGGQYQRLLLALILFVGELGAFLLLGALAIGIILAQVLLLLLLAFAPVALVAAAIPGRGHDFFKGWLAKLAGYLLRKAAYSLILAILLAVNGALAAATAQLGWLMSFGLQSLFFWAVFLQRRTLTDSLIGIATGPGAPGREGTLRVLGLYAGARMGARALGPLRRAAGRLGSRSASPTPRLGTSYSTPVGGGYPSMDAPVEPPVGSKVAAADAGRESPGQSPYTPEPRPPRRTSLPAAGQMVRIGGNPHTVQSVDENGGLYARDHRDDGFSPKTHYWPAGTPWTPGPEAGQKVRIRGTRHTIQSVDEVGGFYARSDPDDGSGPKTHYWGPRTEWMAIDEGTDAAGEPAAGNRDLGEELRAEREAARPSADFPLRQLGLLIEAGQWKPLRDEGEQMPVHAGARSFEAIWGRQAKLAEAVRRTGKVVTERGAAREGTFGELMRPQIAWSARGMMAPAFLGELRLCRTVAVDLDVAEGLPDWESLEEAWAYAQDAELPFPVTYFDFTTPGGYRPKVILQSEDGVERTLTLRAALCKKEGGYLRIAPFAWFEDSEHQPEELRARTDYDVPGVVHFGLAPRLGDAKQLEDVTHLRLTSEEGLSAPSQMLLTAPLLGHPGWIDLYSDLTANDGDARGEDVDNAALMQAEAMIAATAACRVLSVIYALDSTVNIELADAEPSRPERRAVDRALKRGRDALISKTVRIHPTRQTESRRETGAKREYSHAHWRRGHFAHYPLGTRMADRLAEADATKLVDHPVKGLCRKIYRPPTIVGATGSDGEEREPVAKSYVWGSQAERRAAGARRKQRLRLEPEVLLESLRARGRAGVPGLAEDLEVSKQTVRNVGDELVAEGKLEVVPGERGLGGRPREYVYVEPAP